MLEVHSPDFQKWGKKHMKWLKLENLLLMVMITLALLAGQTVLGQGKGKGHVKKHEENSSNRAHQTAIQVKVFGEQDRDLIRNYWSRQPEGLPPGLAKRGGDLPPGLEKQIRRNGHLPPGLEKKVMPFPPDLESRLPPLVPGCRRVIYGSLGIILNNKQIVVDVFDMKR